MSTSSDNGNGYDMNDGPAELHGNRKLSQDDPTMTEVIRIGKSSTNGPIKGFPENMSIKAQLGDDIRRVPLNNEDITYDELVLMMQRLFRGALKSQDEILIKYKDEDGDMITIVDTNDLAFAVEHCQVLHVKIFPKINKKERADISVSLLKQELKGLRDRVDSILDYLDDEEGRILPRFLPSGSFCSDKQSVIVNAATGASSEAGGSRPESKSTVPVIVGAGDRGGYSPNPLGQSKDFDPMTMTSIASVHAHVTDGPTGRVGMVNGTSSAIVVQPQPQQPPPSAQAQAPAQTPVGLNNASDFPPHGIMAMSGDSGSRFGQATATPHAHQVLGVSQSQPGIPPMVSSAQSQAQATAKSASMGGYGGYGSYNPAAGSTGYGGSLPGQQPPSQAQQQQYGNVPQASMSRPTAPQQQQQQQQSIYSGLGGGGSDHVAPSGPYNPMAPPQLGGQAQAQPMAPPSLGSHTLPSQPGQVSAGAQSQQQQATPYPAVSMPNMMYGAAPPQAFPQQATAPYRPPSGPPPSGTPGAFGSNPYSRAANTQQYRPPM